MRIKTKICYLLLIVLFSLTACKATSSKDFPVYTDTSGEIPRDIWNDLDNETKEAVADGRKYVALTFDDGPRYETTSALLDGLQERGAQATFFLIGTQIQCSGNEELLLRMKTEGHQIGNHTYSHMRLLDAQPNSILEEIQKNDVILENLLGEGEYWLRPPYGLIDKKGTEVVKTPMIYWTLDPEDWKLLDAKRVADCVVKNVEDGDIILLHDFYPSSVEAALEIIDRLQPEGYVFVTVEELFQIHDVEPRSGMLYASPEIIRPIC